MSHGHSRRVAARRSREARARRVKQAGQDRRPPPDPVPDDQLQWLAEYAEQVKAGR
jgi:hypothetical protein